MTLASTAVVILLSYSYFVEEVTSPTPLGIRPHPPIRQLTGLSYLFTLLMTAAFDHSKPMCITTRADSWLSFNSSQRPKPEIILYCI